MSDRVHQMRLAESGAAVKKKRIVTFARRVGRAFCGSVRKLIRCSDDKLLERVFRIQRAIRQCGAIVISDHSQSPIVIVGFILNQAVQVLCRLLVKVPFELVAVEPHVAEDLVDHRRVVSGHPILGYVGGDEVYGPRFRIESVKGYASKPSIEHIRV